jgi:hypothetical protein
MRVVVHCGLLQLSLIPVLPLPVFPVTFFPGLVLGGGVGCRGSPTSKLPDYSLLMRVVVSHF